MAVKSGANASASGGAIDRHVVSPSLLQQFETPKPGYIPRPEFLLGLGEPFEPNPWDLASEDDDATMLQASQAAEEQLSDCSKSVRAVSQRAPRSKLIGLFLSGLSGLLTSYQVVRGWS